MVSSEGPFAGKEAASLQLSEGKLIAPDGTAEPLEQAVSRVTKGPLEVYAEHIPQGLPPASMEKVYQG
ncbi:hypothetical protein C1T17_18385 [Sphingobium sp. SCG-1]|nr:hypothetical protein C1T17_18385 [Sphingobium sp. SCG-1]